MLKINRFVTWVLLAVVGISTLVLYSPGLFKTLSDNLAALRDIKNLTLKINPEACSGYDLTYPKYALCIKKLLNQNDLVSADHLYSEFIKSESTGKVFSPYLLAQIEDYRANYPAACNQLQRINSKPSMLLLADRAFSTNNWDGLATYLDCIEQVKLSPGYVNPYRTAVLFNSLGMHLEEIENYREAEIAYSLAGDWYPTIWSDPYVNIARIEAQHGHVDGAINLLLDAFRKATLPQSKYLLMREYGIYNEGAQNIESAICAYREALRLSEGLSADYAPQNALDDLENRINQLQSQSGIANCPVLFQ